MNSSKNNRNSFLKLNDRKELRNDDNKKLSLREKKKSMDLNRLKKKSMDFYRASISRPTNRLERRIISMNATFSSNINNSKLDNSQISLQNSRVVPELNYKGIEKDIKNVILDMANDALLEIRRQSCDELDLYKNKQQLKGQLSNSNTIDTGRHEEIKNKKKKYRRSKTQYNRNFLKYKTRKNTKNTSENSGSVLNYRNTNSTIYDKISTRSIEHTSKSLRFKNESKTSAADKFRFYGRGGIIEDSFNESETDEEEYEEDSFLINPETTAFLIYDIIIFFASLYSSTFISFDIANECFCYQNRKSIKFYLNYGIDILFIIDLFIHFFLQFYSKKDKLIKNRMKIINNYLTGWFFFDFLTALPFNILYYYYCNYYPSQICVLYEKNNMTYYLVMLRYLKSIKIFKMPANKKNQFIMRVTEEASNNPSFTETVDLIIELLLVSFGLHILSCIHIFIGKYTYPGWIFANEFQNFSLSNLYMISVYYLIQTMTTVGYGDISSDSFLEIIFRIILLAVGIICYSWLISNISNSINKQSYASINFQNDLILLENIRREHRDLPFNIYTDVKHYLEHKHFRRNIYDKELLINSLTYSLKNSLIFSMYKTEIQRFSFFKGISNTNFLSEMLYNFTSNICKKNEVLMNENEIIEEIIFVKDGRLSLEIPIDMENPEISTEEYLGQGFMDFAFKFDKENKFNLEDLNISKRSITFLLEEKKDNNLFQYKNEKIKKSNKDDNTIFYLRIYDILKDESYGGIYMFYGKRSPFKVKVKSKRAKLYTIKRDDFSTISETYKNIIQRNHKKEKRHLKMVKNGLIKNISRFCSSNGIKIAEEHTEIINKAVKKINNKMLPDILKNTDLGKTIVDNHESDVEIHKSTLKPPTEKPKKTQKDIINEKRNTLSNLVKESASPFNNLNIRKHKKSYNFIPRGSLGLGIHMLSGFRQNYIEDLGSSKELNYKQKENINKILNIKIENTKKRYSQPLINKIKTKIGSNIESTKSLKGIDFNYNYSESEKSKKTIRLEQNMEIEDINDSYPMTINSLPLSLKDKIKKRINDLKQIKKQNKKEILSENSNEFKMEHISVEINNNNITTTTNNNNSQYNNNTLSNINISKYISQYNNNNLSNFNISNYNLNSTVNDTNNNTNNKTTNNNKRNKKIKRSNSEKKNHNNLIIKDKDNNNMSPKNTKNKHKRVSSASKRKKYKSLIFKKSGKISAKQRLLRLNSSSKNLNIKSPKTVSAYKKMSLNRHSLQKNGDGFSSTSADSFEIKRSYKNINKVSGGRYIKDKKLQKKTMNFIIKYKKEKEKVEYIKTLLTDNYDIKKDHKEEENQFKIIENSIKAEKNKMSDVILKKKKKKQKEIKIDKNNIKTFYNNNNSNNLIKYMSHSHKNTNKKNSTQKHLSLNVNGDMSNSTLRLNSLSINQDETLGKLNASHNDNKIFDIPE